MQLVGEREQLQQPGMLRRELDRLLVELDRDALLAVDARGLGGEQQGLAAAVLGAVLGQHREVGPGMAELFAPDNMAGGTEQSEADATPPAKAVEVAVLDRQSETARGFRRAFRRLNDADITALLAEED